MFNFRTWWISLDEEILIGLIIIIYSGRVYSCHLLVSRGYIIDVAFFHMVFYLFRNERTKLLFCTTGILLRMISVGVFYWLSCSLVWLWLYTCRCNSNLEEQILSSHLFLNTDLNLQGEKDLAGVSHVIVDEVHERSLLVSLYTLIFCIFKFPRLLLLTGIHFCNHHSCICNM